MRLRHLTLIAIALLLSACATVETPRVASTFVAARALRTPPMATMPAGALTTPPGGYDALCGDTPELCGLEDRTSSPEVELAERMTLLSRVNRAVNSEVYPLSAILVGSSPWSRPTVRDGLMTGDCKNYAVEKRQRLLDAGFPAQDLSYAIAYRRDIGLHAVLVARLDGQDFVLDNRSSWVVPWSQAPYVWVKRQSSENPRVWRVAIADDRVRAVQTAALARQDEGRMP